MPLTQPTPDLLKQINLYAVSAAEAEWTKVGLQVGQDIGSYTSGKGAQLHSAIESQLATRYPGVSLSALSQAATAGEAQAASSLGPSATPGGWNATFWRGILGIPGAAASLAASVNPAAVLAGIWDWIQARLVRLGLLLAGAVLIVLSVTLLAKASGVSPPLPVPV
ncbi:MAG: hypothetical protein ACRD2H_13885 [Terriglobales bacterium]